MCGLTRRGTVKYPLNAFSSTVWVCAEHKADQEPRSMDTPGRRPVMQGGRQWALCLPRNTVALALSLASLTACSAFSLCAPLRSMHLRGGSRPWRSIPLEDGEVSFYHTRPGHAGISMTAADWQTVEQVPSDREYPDTRIFGSGLAETDDAVASVLRRELTRQQDGLELIASENIVSRAVLEAQGSVLTNKYAEGYPSKRYYGGCGPADEVEALALERVKQLYECEYANVQPHSGAQANQAVMLALASPGDTILGMSLASGGHLTHGAAPNLSGKWFDAVQYGVREDTGLIDYGEVERLAREHKPRLIIAGGSAYSRHIDFKRFREIADEVGAYFWVDMAHFSGLVAGKAYPSPIPHAHVVTSTTHKTLRGPRGGIILSADAELGKKINSAVFPGLQGGPLMHTIAAKAVAFGEALRPSFREYARLTVDNAKALSDSLREGGLDIVSGGTDSHVILVDLRPKGLTGKVVEAALERAGLTCNKNSVPYDPEKPFVTSGIRLGTPAVTTRGLGPAECTLVGKLILRVVDGLAASGGEEGANAEVEEAVRDEVRLLCARFPIYGTGVPLQ